MIKYRVSFVLVLAWSLLTISSQPALAILSADKMNEQDAAINPSLTRAQKKADKRLRTIHGDIVSDYPGVNHLDADRFSAFGRDEILVFDVRKPSEYAVSHLPGAINIPPDMSADAFVAAFGEKLGDRSVVFYCSVGRRSSIMAERVASQLADTNPSYNLVGGIFRWRNEERPLAVSRPDGSTLPTGYVHPYNALWGRYVADRQAIRYTPAPVEETSSLPANR
ncbi:MAG: rhodanese-like domain-containing protein [Pseudomonadota bacterium]